MLAAGRYMRNQGFGRAFAGDLHDIVTRARQQNEGRISVYTYCRSGKHRGPAVTEILAIISRQITGMTIYKVYLGGYRRKTRL